MRCRTFLDKWVFIGILLDKIQKRDNQPLRRVLAFIQTLHINRSSFSCLWRARLPRIFPFTFYSGKQEGILVAVQTRSPIARGNWVDIGNESKEQITRGGVLLGEVANRWVASGLGRSLCVSDGRQGFETARSWSALRRTYGTRFYGTREGCSERPW